jgi:hypothetical protein
MIPVFACQTPCNGFQPKLPKRLARLRRTIESKRIENFKKIHEELKRTAKEEQQALRDFWRGLGTEDDEKETEVVKDDDEE